MVSRLVFSFLAKAELEQLGGETEKKKRKVRTLHMAIFIIIIRSAHEVSLISVPLSHTRM